VPSHSALPQNLRHSQPGNHKLAGICSHCSLLHSTIATTFHNESLTSGSLACAGGAGSGDSLQDILRILTLWFNHGAAADVEAALQDGFSRVSIDTWLVVIPQVRQSGAAR